MTNRTPVYSLLVIMTVLSATLSAQSKHYQMRVVADSQIQTPNFSSDTRFEVNAVISVQAAPKSGLIIQLADMKAALSEDGRARQAFSTGEIATIKRVRFHVNRIANESVNISFIDIELDSRHYITRDFTSIEGGGFAPPSVMKFLGVLKYLVFDFSEDPRPGAIVESPIRRRALGGDAFRPTMMPDRFYGVKSGRSQSNLFVGNLQLRGKTKSTHRNLVAANAKLSKQNFDLKFFGEQQMELYSHVGASQGGDLPGDSHIIVRMDEYRRP